MDLNEQFSLEPSAYMYAVNSIKELLMTDSITDIVFIDTLLFLRRLNTNVGMFLLSLF